MFTYNEHTKIMNIRNLISVLWSQIAIAFGKKYDPSVIPEGVYCYSPDIVKNGDFFTCNIIMCPYYKGISNHVNGCKFMGKITDDFQFDDACKMCNVKRHNYLHDTSQD